MAASGLIIVDKPGGMTSHDVVARVRRLAGTRRVGHAGTLDPMATGVLVVGVDKATRLLGYLTLATKQYLATIRLGQSTSTDDADGEVVAAPGAAAVRPDAVLAATASLTGEVIQQPPAVSAIKVGGQRAYRITRAGGVPELCPRAVTVHRIDVLAVRDAGRLVDVDVDVTCSSGTYIRAIARDLGAALGTGGHLAALRRIRAGPYRADDARTLDQLAESLSLIPLAEAAAAAFPRVYLTASQAGRLAHGGRVSTGNADGQPAAGPPPLAGEQPAEPVPGEPAAAFAPDGSLVALVTSTDGSYRPLAVFAG
jgi:tRNA pseudouridine55 synthase